MNATHRNPQDTRLLDALRAGNSSTRLQAALAAGTCPDPGFAEVLVARCAVEPDFFVRDMLTWALTRLPPEVTVPRLRAQLRSATAQARSQALHTLSKIGDRSVWPAITRSLLHDADDEVARSAWRAAVVLVPAGQRDGLAADLAAQLGRGDRDVQLSLSRALVALGDVIEPAVRSGGASADPAVRVHARATQRLLHDPEAGFDAAVEEAKRIAALGPERVGGAAC
ncbi:HEAT repeat domain-containing protein [Amycolatopsis endophytica]|uniref:HEAT repeat protein n=1 Tax=Amycolatopsis endophytica TaxID=860233 RepID=A0A853BBF1_9PSEU|nr:HEAT repeat protein [Amycolatopsis endophytica]